MQVTRNLHNQMVLETNQITAEPMIQIVGLREKEEKEIASLNKRFAS